MLFRLFKYFTFSIVLLSSCNEELDDLKTAYVNDFETANDENLTNAHFETFNGEGVCGPYNNESLILNLVDLPDHDYLIISFDLYIHDSWDGIAGGVDGPDIWGIEVNDWIDKKKDSRTRTFVTTFSNSVCNTTKCLLQSFPENFPFSTNPRSANTGEQLPGRCSRIDQVDGTSRYNIVKTFQHESKVATIKFYDQLVQTNTNQPKCDESWSIDNILVETATFN